MARLIAAEAAGRKQVHDRDLMQDKSRVQRLETSSAR